MADDEGAVQSEPIDQLGDRACLSPEPGSRSGSAQRVPGPGPIDENHSMPLRESIEQSILEVTQLTGEAMDHYDRDTPAPIDVMESCSIDIHVLPGSRERCLDAPRRTPGVTDERQGRHPGRSYR